MIETLDDWNDKLEQCGCCFMPECPEFFVKNERKYATGLLNQFWGGVGTISCSCEDMHLYYRKLITRETSDTSGYGFGSTEYIFDEDGVTGPFIVGDGALPLPGDAVFVGQTCDGANMIDTYTYTAGDEEDPDFNGTYTNEVGFAEPFTPAEANALILVDAETKIEEDDWESFIEVPASSGLPFVISLRSDEEYVVSDPCPTPESLVAIILQVMRFRFRIPDTHTGSYFKITYDIAEFPDDGAPSLVSEDNVIEWTGPGTGASSDPSWLTDWVVIEPPDVSGERRIVNVRYTCYSGAKYGAKPQLVGEAFP
jgi:hypothetical protein